MAHLKLPAYGKQLLLRRRTGEHPLEVALILGRDWRADVGEIPILAINPEDYAPGKFDFHVVAGLRVVVHDQDMHAEECDDYVRPPAFGVFYDLLTELARSAAGVYIRWPEKLGWEEQEVRWLARQWQRWDRAASRMQWPRWWSDELNADYLRRWSDWMRYFAYTRGILDDWRAEAA